LNRATDNLSGGYREAYDWLNNDAICGLSA